MDHDKTYAQHEIRSESGNSWTLYHRSLNGVWRGTYWTQIIVGHSGSVIITGDGPDLIVRNWGVSETPEQALAVLERFAGSGPDYIAKKVVIGERYEIDVDKAREEISEYVAEYNASRDEAIPSRLIDLDDLTTVHDAHDVERVREEIYGETGECEIPEFGRVISYNLLSAQAAARRLVAILRERESTTQSEAASL